MYGNEDWEALTKRHEAWWNGDVLDRVGFKVTSPKDGAQPNRAFFESLVEDKWWNPEYIVKAQREALANTYHGGDAFAWFFPNLGTDLFSGVLGAEIKYTELQPGSPPFEYSCWAVPFVADWARFTPRFDPDCPLWQRALRLVWLALDDSNGDYLVGTPDLIGGIDCMSSMRGAEALCMDMMDDPELIAQKLSEIADEFRPAYDQIHAILYARQGFAPATIPMCHPGRYFVNINDFTCMISPRMYRELIVPDLERELSMLDASVYHLDGPGAIAHLDAIFEQPKVRAIQWVPGAGREDIRKWLPLLHSIQQNKRSVYLYCRPGEVPLVLDSLRPEGLMIECRCASETDARALLRLVESHKPLRMLY